MSFSEIQLAFNKQYQEKVGERYIPTYGRDGKIFKDLLLNVGRDRLLACIDEYFNMDQKIYSPVFFKCCINDLMQKTKVLKKQKLVSDDRYF